jgi:glycine/D-amino acid oxidase-like deaminating enzyme
MTARYDIAIVGGGWFGCAIADFLTKRHGKIVIVEREPALLQRASYNNQARVHNGYHYPRSLQTAYRSRINFKLFARDYPECIVNDFVKLYCIAGRLSKVTPLQFERFCNLIGAPWKRATKVHADLFQRRLIAAVYQVEETIFDSTVLAAILAERLSTAGVEVRLNTTVECAGADGNTTRITLSDGSEISAAIVFNCTYAGLKRVPGLSENLGSAIKHELTEMALIEPPTEMTKLGVTVMDGPFFSTIPFPARGLHTLSHVRYTPHGSWIEDGDASRDPYTMLSQYDKESRARHMLLDAARYMPCLAKARIVDSLFEVKTLLQRNEVDDGRPILMERSAPPTIYSILGGKIDNIYDVLERLRTDGL